MVKFFAQGEAGKAIFIDDVTIRDGAFDDEAVIPTAISLSSTPITHHPSPVYDLQGRRVSDASGKGVYVINGKKYIK